MHPSFSLSLLFAGLLLAGCDQVPSLASAAAPSLVLSPWGASSQIKAEDLRFAGEQRLAASEKRGLLLLDAQGAELARLPGNFSGLDSRSLGEQLLVASLDAANQRPTLALLDPTARQWGRTLALPARDYAVTGLCLYRDEAANLYLFLVGEEGRGEQWLVGSGSELSSEALRVRGLPLPPQAEFCQVDDAANQLLVNEENVGLWAYPAHPEAEASRVAVDMVKPFGGLEQGVGAMAAVPGGVLALDVGARRLHLYQRQGEAWQATGSVALQGMEEPERLAVREGSNGLELLLQDDGSGSFYEGELAWKPQPVAVPEALVNVTAQRQSEPVGRHGDAADDPAIWVDSVNPARSRVLGTNKKQGLLVYDLDGKLLQDLPVGRLNNVDLRPNFSLGGERVDLAVASDRDRNSIAVFAIDRASGELRAAGEVRTPLKEIYGICLFQPASGELYAFANGKDGSFLQYRLSDNGGEVSGELVRRFAVPSQPEGCVADDQRQRLFLGEEDTGVWAVDARADGPTELHEVMKVGGALHADVEGLGLYQSEARDYLVVSSQGNDSYLVLDAEPPFALRGAFRVGANGALGIDGASETDGLEVTSANLGGPWSQGMLVVQDGRKRMPEATQNFKFVPWSEVARALGLE
ncbi:phytase [Pseudomonas sp. Gutcm_11s]|uniref:phytase n=1 Tax=Pseudomonas sp. Gutcm_11s TaxID=3026088 RepID=UPI002362F829|nr:phytase [Pseudomonas sp. Gutcm_11s]MDD0841259.1 phytase [Pseudomonas sp. Gutcm_11s]